MKASIVIAKIFYILYLTACIGTGMRLVNYKVSFLIIYLN
jgi:hypothetical protein